jgi:hypothetical protein
MLVLPDSLAGCVCREKIMHAAIYKYLAIFPEDVSHPATHPASQPSSQPIWCACLSVPMPAALPLRAV